MSPVKQPRNYWYIETNDTGCGFTCALVRVQWDVADWRVPWVYGPLPKKRAGQPVLVSNERSLLKLAYNHFIPRLRDHDLIYLTGVAGNQYRRVGDLMARRAERRAK